MKNNRFDKNLKLVGHPEFWEYLETGRTDHPISVEISLTGKCDAACKMCLYRNKRNNDFLDEAIIKKAIEDMYVMGVKAITWTGGGEPTLHSAFEKISQFTFGQRIQQGLFTNALRPIKYDPSIFEWVRVTYAREHRQNIENLKILRQCKTFGIVINVNSNEDEEIEKAYQLVLDSDADYLHIRPMVAIDGQHVSIIRPDKWENKDKIIFNNFKFVGENGTRSYTQCRGYHFMPFIWENGNVTACGYFCSDKKYLFGNLYKDDFRTIFQRMPESVPVCKTCQDFCKNHENNTLIDLHVEKKIDDFNFI